MSWEMGAVRVIFVIILTAAAIHLRPFGLSGFRSAGLGLLLGLFFIFFEIRLEKASLKRLLGAAFGSILGILGALMISHLLSMTAIDKAANSFFQVTLLLLMAYVGLVLGSNKGELLNLGALGGLFHHGEGVAQELQNSRHQRYHRRPHRGRLRNQFR